MKRTMPTPDGGIFELNIDVWHLRPTDCDVLVPNREPDRFFSFDRNQQFKPGSGKFPFRLLRLNINRRFVGHRSAVFS